MIHKTHKIFALPGALAAPADLGAFLKFRLFVVRNTRSTAHPTKHLKKAVFFFGGGGRGLQFVKKKYTFGTKYFTNHVRMVISKNGVLLNLTSLFENHKIVGVNLWEYMYQVDIYKLYILTKYEEHWRTALIPRLSHPIHLSILSVNNTALQASSLICPEPQRDSIGGYFPHPEFLNCVSGGSRCSRVTRF